MAGSDPVVETLMLGCFDQVEGLAYECRRVRRVLTPGANYSGTRGCGPSRNSEPWHY
jgi:hypothetical protein